MNALEASRRASAASRSSRWSFLSSKIALLAGLPLLMRPYALRAAPYAASKSAVVGLSLALRAEARARGVRVTVVCPGSVRTEITPDAQSQRWRVLATPDRLAAAVLRGLDADRTIVVWPPSARLAWWLQRVSPGLGSAIAAKLARRVTARNRRRTAAAEITRAEY